VELADYGAGIFVAYGLGGGLTAFTMSTGFAWLTPQGHRTQVWLAVMLLVTVISCCVSRPVLSRLASPSSARTVHS
jgi:hypothetical protein